MSQNVMAKSFDEAAAGLGPVGNVLLGIPDSIKIQAHEIRLRCLRPISVSLPEDTVFVTASGEAVLSLRDDLVCPSRSQMDEAFVHICGASVHSHQQEIKNGFVTLPGGHRAGICGTAIVQNGEITNIRDITSINLRIAREIKGSADAVTSAVLKGGRARGTLIAGPPGCGKTTVLRDLARQLSNGRYGYFRVAVVDERGEIAAAVGGTARNDLGPCCDVLDGYPKGEGFIQALRSLSPDVIICDEIGTYNDAKSVEMSLNAGVAVVASAHAGSFGELVSRPQITSILDTGAFGCVVMLRGREQPGRIARIYEAGEIYDAQTYRRRDDNNRLWGCGSL